MKHSTRSAKVLLLGLWVAGCTTTGTGISSPSRSTPPVNFSWKSSDSVSGAMSATLADGTTYTGQYFQITSDTTTDFGGGMLTGPLGGAGFFEAGPAYQTHYSGRVLADLANPSGDHLRCGFQLIHPSSGMASGAHGLCQTPRGNVIEVALHKS